MNHAIVVSTKDPAGMNIKERLISEQGFQNTGETFDTHPTYRMDGTTLYTTDKDSVHCERIDTRIDADMIIFATKHQSTSGIHSLSVHAPGNWAKAEYGGEDRRLCRAPADYLRQGFLLLSEKGKDMHYEIVQECTHHGPFVQTPCMFIEIGSAHDEWVNPAAGSVIASVIKELVTKKVPLCKTAFGIGGLHTTPNLIKAVQRGEYGLGHVCPKYMVEHLDKKMIEQAMERHTHKVDSVILDWKGLKGEKERIVGLLKEMGIEYLRTTDF